MWDFGVAQLILALTVFNLNVMWSGLTYLEFRNMMETRITQMVRRTDSEDNKMEMPKSMMKFHYGFATKYENIVRTLRTTNFVAGCLFLKWGENASFDFNGSEWTTFWYRDAI